MSYVKRGRDDVENFACEDIHGGEGTVYVRQLLGYEPKLPVPGHPEDFETLLNFMHETTLTEGSTIGLHPHEGNEEIYYVVKGKGRMTVDGESMIMKPGDACLTKDGSKHKFENIGDEELRIIVIEAVKNEEDKNY